MMMILMMTYAADNDNDYRCSGRMPYSCVVGGTSGSPKTRLTLLISC